MSHHRFLSDKPKWLVPLAAIGGLLLVILLALGVLGGDSKTKPGTTSIAARTVPANAATVRIARQAEAGSSVWQGTLRSRLAVKIAPKLNARIVEMPVHPGDRLKKGQLIAKLDDRDLQAAYNAANAAYVAAQAQAAQAGADEKRIVDLYQKQAATRQNYDAVIAQAKAARAMANQAASAAQQSKVMLGENVLYAPFDGVVGERFQEPGDMAVPNRPVISFHQPDDLRLEAAIASQCAVQLELGATVSVRIDALRQTLAGTIDEISPEIDPQTLTQQVKVNLPKTPGLQHGQFAWLEARCQAPQAVLLVPASAIVQFGQLQAVRVVEGGQWQMRHIRSGKRYGDQLEVLSGLKDGETILLQGELGQ
ncbi:efflux RND transporter periplasmic adaptor subunit [Methylomonas sp. DH-1]|uniref:efflux RND transporter periplasmic adaptor subunit n=1 Tax=Methylomonas sp. (strain DH-1) TaxID=1727196 RepID=UPI0007C95C57|nr:efflux RND transporter periplasmic adaptor subunit [Methylomonas sp. DH-1]ANE54782.1 efflux transporter periplasmic adaptor subunit [Methylomonas sp. DH-1]